MNYLAHLYANMLAHQSDVLWNSFGFLGGAIFGIRFLIQWLKSEGKATASSQLASGMPALAAG